MADMLNQLTKILAMAALLACGAPLLPAQTSNRVWFAVWGGQPTPSSDVAVQSITTGGGAAVVTNALSFVSQTNFPSFVSPYDIAVDPTMGKGYVLDSSGGGVLYSFNLVGTPAQIAASWQQIYNPGAGPVTWQISGLALDAVNHYLYFNQFDPVSGTNSFVGRLNLASSSKTELYSTNSGNPTLQTFYVGQVPGYGSIAIGSTNFYLGAYNPQTGGNGVFVAPVSGAGGFTELVTISAGDTTFASGIIGGVASYSQSNLVYYLTSDAGALNHNYTLSQNALWTYNTATHISTLIASNYMGYPDNIALDPANKRYFFTVGEDGTGNASPTNYQAIYTGTIGSTSAPTTLFTPALSGQDIGGGANAGVVSLQGIFVQDLAGSYVAPVARPETVTAEKNLTLEVPVAALVAADTDPNGGTLGVSAVSGTSTNGGNVVLSGNAVFYTPATNFVGQDQFTYTLADSEGTQAQGTVSVNVVSLNPPGHNSLMMIGAPGNLFLLYAGAGSAAYAVQYANSLPGPWFTLSPNLTAGTSGLVEFNDLTTSGSRTRFYRVVLVSN